MVRWDDNLQGSDFRVVWRWRETHGHATYPERRKGFKTREGAERLLAKLTSNGGRYTKLDDPNDYGYDGGFIATDLILEYARIEQRRVGPWGPIEVVD